VYVKTLCIFVFVFGVAAMTAQSTNNLPEQLSRGNIKAVASSTSKDAVRRFDVMSYGAVGDGIADDTVAVQSAINAAAGSAAYFPGGYTYSVSNLTLPSGTTLQGDGFGSRIVARNGGSAAYLIASESFLVSGRTSFDGEQGIVDLNINGAGIKGSVVVLRAWDSHVTGNWIYGSNGATTIGLDSNVGADLLLTTHGMDGTDLASGVMVNGYIDHNRLGFGGGNTALYNFRTYDPNFKASDWFLESNWIDGEDSTISDVLIMDSGGWLIRGNHMYGPKYSAFAICIPISASQFTAGCDLTAQEPNFDTIVAENYFEDSVGYQLSGRDGKFSVFGPGNIVGQTGHPHSAYFVAGFGNYTNDVTISQANAYYDGQIIQDYSDPSKVLTSIGDVFSNSEPIINIGAGIVNMWSIVNNGALYTTHNNSQTTSFQSPPHFGGGNTQIVGGNKIALTLSNNTGEEQIQFFGNSQQITGLQGQNGQNLATCTGSLASGNLSTANANGNCADSGKSPSSVLKRSESAISGKVVCWTASGTIGSCSTMPDARGGCLCN
jgi:hypothetical protein